MSILYSKAALSPMTLQNHLVMTPMTRSRATDNIPNTLMLNIMLSVPRRDSLLQKVRRHHQMAWVTRVYLEYSHRFRSRDGSPSPMRCAPEALKYLFN